MKIVGNLAAWQSQWRQPCSMAATMSGAYSEHPWVLRVLVVIFPFHFLTIPAGQSGASARGCSEIPQEMLLDALPSPDEEIWMGRIALNEGCLPTLGRDDSVGSVPDKVLWDVVVVGSPSLALWTLFDGRGS